MLNREVVYKLLDSRIPQRENEVFVNKKVHLLKMYWFRGHFFHIQRHEFLYHPDTDIFLHLHELIGNGNEIDRFWWFLIRWSSPKGDEWCFYILYENQRKYCNFFVNSNYLPYPPRFNFRTYLLLIKWFRRISLASMSINY